MAEDGSTGRAAGEPRGAGPLVSSLDARGSSVAVIGGDVHGNIIFGGDLRAPADLVLDFSSVIDAATRRFVGRRDVFAALESFRAGASRGYFEIVADAGLGKTALAAAIASRRNALAFFASQSRGLTQPRQFLTHICAALVTRYALPYDHLPARAGEDSTFLSRLLEEAAASGKGDVWIVVDALDEAETPPPGANALLLPAHLPANVYVVVTHRPVGRLWTQPDTPRVPYELRADAAEQTSDIEEYVRLRATQEAPLAEALSRIRPPVTPETFIRRLSAASRGNFMYVSYMLSDLEVLDRAGTPLDLDRLPDGLEGYYEQFWAEMNKAKAGGWSDWKGLFGPVVERLAVAAESVTAEWLGAQVGRDPDEVRERVLMPWSRLLSREVENGRESWRVVHRSFSEFLARKVNLAAAHKAVASYYATARWGKWDEFDDYGLRHTPAHLAAAAAAEQDAAERHALTQTLSSLVLDPGYQQRLLNRLRDPAALERALSLALDSTCLDDRATVANVAEVGLRLVAFRKEQRQPGPIFDLAREGDIGGAERRLDLFALEVDATWYQALLLVIAWLAASRDPANARALRDRVRKELAGLPPSATLDLLRARVDVTLDGAPMPPLWLPSPPPPDQAQGIVLRLATATDRPGADVELLNRMDLVTGTKGYLAEADGPALVAVSLAAPPFGEPLLKQYVAMHAAYGYREYRQGSLWALLDAVLQHPSQEWAQSWAGELGAAVLAPNRGEFRECLGVVALALQTAAGEPGARQALDTRLTMAVEASEAEEPLPATNLVLDPPPRGRGDTWGTNRRRLAALAEALSRVPGEDAQVGSLVTRALQLQWGFAGFNAPACLALAEAVEVSGGGAARIQDALAGARTSAQNIQDAVFCARTTARVDAMMTRWHGDAVAGGFDVEDCAARLVRDPSNPEFATIHRVGEAYPERDPGTTIPLSSALLTAATLRQLAAAYQRPLDDFLRLNGGRTADEPLPPGTSVNVPDPGYPPLLASRLAARALSTPSLSQPRQERVVRTLVPLAAAEPTALDLVLARLLLASRSQDGPMLARLVALSATGEPTVGPEVPAGAHLTRFMP